MKKFCFSVITLLVFSVFHSGAFSPFVKNWSQADYDAANQNWALARDSRGSIYVGNHKGLLEFDGFRWTLHQIGRGDIVRSLYVDADDRIYVGAQNDFGFFERDACGRLVYTSLMQALAELPDKKDMQVWSIVEDDGKIFFQTYWGYFSFDGSSVECTEAHFQLNRLSKIGESIYYHHRRDIFEFDEGHLRRPNSSKGKGNIKSIVSFFHAPDVLLAVTEKDGIVKYDGKSYTEWPTEADSMLKSANPNRAVMTEDSLLVIGTVLDGVFAIDRNGCLKWHLNTDNGLQNNTVLDILCDNGHNLWLALDYGVSRISGDNAVSIKTIDRNVGSVFDVEYFGDHIYVATNQGLFRMPKSPLESDVELVPDMEGFVLSLYRTDDNRLIAGHGTKTVMIYPDGHIKTLSYKGGGMCVRPFAVGDRDYLMVSSYTAMSVYGKDSDGEWKYLYDMKGFDDPVRYFETDADGRIWAAHSRRGLYCIETDAERQNAVSVKSYQSLSSDSNVRAGVFKVKDRLVFTDGSKCYVHDGIRYEIVSYDMLNDGLGEFASAHDIVPAGKDEYWFITDKASALVRLSGVQKPEILKTVVYKDYDFRMLDGRENIVPVDSGHSLLCVHNAVALVSYCTVPGKSVSNAYISGIRMSDGAGEEVLLELCPSKMPSVRYAYNNMTFNVSSCAGPSRPAVRYMLDGIDAGWQKIPDDGVVVYNRLPSGHYSFYLMQDDGQTVSSWPFVIRPPFYASWWAWCLYALLLGGAVALSVILTRRGNRAAMDRLREKNVQEIMKIENERLQDEIAFKGKQLASSSMNLIRRSEMLHELLEELDRQKAALGSQYPKKYYDKLKSMIEANLSSDEEWEVFQANFDLIHDGFFRILADRYPDLSPSDLKLCALLRLNMDTKEIAKMINITVRGVETRRYRLRQKLGLRQEDSLSKFLMDIK